MALLHPNSLISILTVGHLWGIITHLEYNHIKVNLQPKNGNKMGGFDIYLSQTWAVCTSPRSGYSVL